MTDDPRGEVAALLAGFRLRVAWRPEYATICAADNGRADHKAGLMLAQMIWLELGDKGEPPTGERMGKRRVCREGDWWVRAPHTAWQQDLGLTPRQAGYMVGKLVRRGILDRETFADRDGAAVHLRVRWDTILTRLQPTATLAPASYAQGTTLLSHPPTAPEAPAPELCTGYDTFVAPPELRTPNPEPCSLLIAAGISDGAARKLAASLAEDAQQLVPRYLAAYRDTWQPAGKGVAYLVKAIRERWPLATDAPPPGQRAIPANVQADIDAANQEAERLNQIAIETTLDRARAQENQEAIRERNRLRARAADLAAPFRSVR